MIARLLRDKKGVRVTNRDQEICYRYDYEKLVSLNSGLLSMRSHQPAELRFQPNKEPQNSRFSSERKTRTEDKTR